MALLGVHGFRDGGPPLFNGKSYKILFIAIWQMRTAAQAHNYLLFSMDLKARSIAVDHEHCAVSDYEPWGILLIIPSVLFI